MACTFKKKKKERENLFVLHHYIGESFYFNLTRFRRK